MTSLAHFAEPRPAHGGLAAEGALNLLGRPDMDPLVVLVREAVQNSWDARDRDAGPVDFVLHLRTLTGRQRRTLTESAFAELPPRGLGWTQESLLELEDALAQPDMQILTLTDTGTTGLGGPIRADTPADAGEPTDFVDLVFNIGQPPDRELGGGTYGFGKTIAYLVSRCRTVVIHTVTENRGRLEHRFIAEAIGHQYAYRRRNHTGRHWWGVVKPHGIEPLVGRAAAKLAASLGLPDLEEAGGGTTLAVLAPDLGGRTPEQATTFLATALTWNFWPKMVPEGRRRAGMRFAVLVNDVPVPVPDPAKTPPLDGYLEALKAVRECEAGRRRPEDYPTFHVFELRSLRPRASLGWLAMHAVPVRARPEADEGFGIDGEPVTAAAFTEPSHHIALMRRAELVVQYRPGPELTNPAVEWAGVFRASVETDPAFAEAEPPTHDDWRAGLVVDGWYKRYVNVALRELRDKANGAFGAPISRSTATESRSGVLIADALGALLATNPGTGASKIKREPGGGTGGRRLVPSVSVTRRWFEMVDREPVLKIEFNVVAASGSSGTAVEVVTAAATADGGLESDPPAGAPVPRVAGLEHGGHGITGARLTVDAGDQSPIIAIVVQPRGVAAAVEIRPTAEAAS
ncbi:MAG: hypothetical protein QOD39_933 [Mycobacterium sp.]|jgi:hypothetical protein|nr:hypothetical protein [Mycobacterium sp.]